MFLSSGKQNLFGEWAEGKLEDYSRVVADDVEAFAIR